MKTNSLLKTLAFCIMSLCWGSFVAQVPIANFSISPNPACQGSTVQIIDLSTGVPVAWSYTVRGMGPGPGPGGNVTTYTVQNPVLILNNAGVYTISLVATNSNGSSAPQTKTLQVLAGPTGQLNPSFQSSCVGGLPLFISVSNIGSGGASYTYSWSTGSTSTSVFVNPSVTTIYSCVITASNGCSITRTSTVSVVVPNVNLSSIPFSLCPGGSSTINAMGQAPGPFSYTWSTGANTQTISSNLAGVYDVTVTNANGCTATKSYTLGTSVNLSVTASANPSLLCAGGTSTLRALGASTYTWSNGASIPNPIVSPVTSTTYTVYGASGTCTGSAVLSVSVNANPTVVVVSSPPTLCSGNSATLTASGAGSYTWVPAGILSSSMVVTPSVNSTYMVRGSNPGCPVRTSTFQLTVLPTPVLFVSSSASIICANENVALAASGASTYVWNTGATGAVIIVSPANTLTYTVTGTAANSCTASAAITQSAEICEGVAGIQNFDQVFKIYPTFGEGPTIVKSDKEITLILNNQFGQTIKVLNLSSKNNHQEVLEYLPSGVYFISGEINGKIVRKTFIVAN